MSEKKKSESKVKLVKQRTGREVGASYGGLEKLRPKQTGGKEKGSSDGGSSTDKKE